MDEKITAEQRYRAFLAAAAEKKEVWLLESEDGFVTFDTEEAVCLPVWADRETCAANAEPGETPTAMDTEHFAHQLGHEEDFCILVDPADEDSDAIVAEPEQLLADLEQLMGAFE